MKRKRQSKEHIFKKIHLATFFNETVEDIKEQNSICRVRKEKKTDSMDFYT